MVIAAVLLGAVAVFSPTQPAYAGFETISIDDNDTGGDCEDIGKWNSKTKTCRLTVDTVMLPIEIVDDGITLNCDGALLDGTIPVPGINLVATDAVLRRSYAATRGSTSP